jgi:hypothetical protein
MRDLHNTTSAVNALNGATIGSSTTTAGPTIDCQGFDSLEIIVRSSAWTDGAFAVNVTESDASASGFTAAPASSVLGAGQSIGAANTLAKVGYIGTKRYVRVSIVSTGVTSGGHLSAVGVLARQRHTGGQAV